MSLPTDTAAQVSSRCPIGVLTDSLAGGGGQRDAGRGSQAQGQVPSRRASWSCVPAEATAEGGACATGDLTILLPDLRLPLCSKSTSTQETTTWLRLPSERVACLRLLCPTLPLLLRPPVPRRRGTRFPRQTVWRRVRRRSTCSQSWRRAPHELLICFPSHFSLPRRSIVVLQVVTSASRVALTRRQPQSRGSFCLMCVMSDGQVVQL